MTVLVLRASLAAGGRVLPGWWGSVHLFLSFWTLFVL